MKAIGLTLTIVVVSVYLALTHLETLMELGALKFPLLDIYLAPALLFGLVATTAFSGLYVLMSDAREARYNAQKTKKSGSIGAVPMSLQASSKTHRKYLNPTEARSYSRS
jgi:hypothetical protein